MTALTPASLQRLRALAEQINQPGPADPDALGEYLQFTRPTFMLALLAALDRRAEGETPDDPNFYAGQPKGDPVPVVKACVWTENDEGYWDTGCGHAYSFMNDDGPVGNKQAFCGYCGGTLREVKCGADAPAEGR